MCHFPKPEIIMSSLATSFLFIMLMGSSKTSAAFSFVNPQSLAIFLRYVDSCECYDASIRDSKKSL